MTGNNRSPIDKNYNQWSALQFIEPDIPSTTFAETMQEPKKIFLIDGITTDGLFNLLSIFFVSTVVFFIALILASLSNSNHMDYANIIAILISIFLTGYATIFALIFMFYTIRFSEFFRSLYKIHEQRFKIATFLSIIIIPSIIFSILTTSKESVSQIAGFSGLAIIAVVLIVTQSILLELAKPYTQRISNWLLLFKKID